MNRDVFLSILAMDAYQRGYATGINGITGTQIGNATISQQSDIRAGSEAVSTGFYALSYTLDEAWAGLAEGTTVISYRGTDFDMGMELLHDVWFGWSTFTGFGPTAQYPYAQAFYQAVTGADFRDGNDPTPANVIVTGHCLGCGLAGLTAVNNDRAIERIAA